MSDWALRLLEHIHGHLAWLSTLALYHPALMLGRAGRRAQLASVTSTALTTLTAALGAMLYPSYRTAVKPLIYAASIGMGAAFERKEHLAVAVVALSWAGLVAHWAAGRDRVSGHSLPQLATVAYAAAAGLATLTAVLGLLVAVHCTF